MRSLKQAVAYAVAEVKGGDDRWYRLCLAFVRSCWGIPSTGIPSAIKAWDVFTEHKHTTGTPPKGAPVYWRGGTWGHVALSAGGGYVYSNDIVRRGRINKVKISKITKDWGFTYLGWSSDYCGTDLPIADGKITKGDQVWVDIKPTSTLNARLAPGGEVGSSVKRGYKIDVTEVSADGKWARGTKYWYATEYLKEQ